MLVGVIAMVGIGVALITGGTKKPAPPPAPHVVAPAPVASTSSEPSVVDHAASHAATQKSDGPSGADDKADSAVITSPTTPPTPPVVEADVPPAAEPAVTPDPELAETQTEPAEGQVAQTEVPPPEKNALEVPEVPTPPAPPKPELMGSGPIYQVLEFQLTGPELPKSANPSTEVSLKVVFGLAKTGEPQADGQPAYALKIPVHGYWDGGNVWKVRFNPVAPGHWHIAEIESRHPFSGLRVGDYIEARASSHPGFWFPGVGANGRWFGRSNGETPYIIGNTHYDFLFAPDGHETDAKKVAQDVTDNAKFFNKLRFCLMSPRPGEPRQVEAVFEGWGPHGRRNQPTEPGVFLPTGRSRGHHGFQTGHHCGFDPGRLYRRPGGVKARATSDTLRRGTGRIRTFG